jgi:hypothetical protein
MRQQISGRNGFGAKDIRGLGFQMYEGFRVSNERQRNLQRDPKLVHKCGPFHVVVQGVPDAQFNAGFRL